MEAKKDVIIGKLYRVKRKINGAFGEVFDGINIKTQMEVSIKLEPLSTKHP